MIDRREGIRKVLRGERGERLPRALFGAGRWAYQQTGLKMRDLTGNPDGFAELLTEFLGTLDTDIVFPGSGLNTFAAEAIGGDLAFREEQVPLLSFPLIQKTDDALSLGQVDISHSPHTLALVEMVSGLRKGLPDRFFCATSWGPFAWAMILCDWNLLREKTATDRTFIREVCELGVRLSFALFESLIDKGLIDAIVIPDGAVTLIPNDLYIEAVLPCEKKLFEMVRARGLWCFLHQCGNIRSQLDLYPETGADCISVDAGVPIGDVYELYQRRLVTAGNVDVIKTIFSGDSVLIRQAVSDCVAAIADPFRRYILMPSCDLPPDTPLRNIKEFLASADRC